VCVCVCVCVGVYLDSRVPEYSGKKLVLVPLISHLDLTGSESMLRCETVFTASLKQCPVHGVSY